MEKVYEIKEVNSPFNDRDDIVSYATEGCLELDTFQYTEDSEEETYTTITLHQLRTILEIISSRGDDVFRKGSLMTTVDEVMSEVKRLIK